jgi:hypothetical protein
MKFLETSAKDSVNLEELIILAIKEIMEKQNN